MLKEIGRAWRLAKEIVQPTPNPNFQEIFYKELKRFPFGAIVPKEVDFGSKNGGKVVVDARLAMDGDKEIMILTNLPNSVGPQTIYISH